MKNEPTITCDIWSVIRKHGFVACVVLNVISAIHKSEICAAVKHVEVYASLVIKYGGQDLGKFCKVKER